MLRLILALLMALPGSAHKIKFIRVKGGFYRVGAPGHSRNPLRSIKLTDFEIAATELTNAQFADFIKATGYLTDAEKNGYGMTFQEGLDDWKWVSTAGADWRHPFGPGRPGIEGHENHPVTQISYNDAKAYCRWTGFRLPTVEEWEVAARAGRKAGAETPR